MEINLKPYPVIIFDRHIDLDTRSGRATRAIIECLEAEEVNILTAKTAHDALNYLRYSPQISALVFDWDSLDRAEHDEDAKKFLEQVNHYNDQLPVFVLTQRHEIEDTNYESLSDVTGYFWKYADTADFITGRIKEACEQYITALHPTFFKTLVEYTEKFKYAWHTPGHMGGVAFLKSPVGQVFYNFYGENAFRSDLSISVPELGSLMEHSGVNGAAEREAAKTFGADKTYFVTNGTSTSNKIVIMGTVTHGDVAIIDRNCHKSLQHALTMANVIPIYFIPTRNAYGIIGGIPRSEFSADTIHKKVNDCPLINNKATLPKIAVITNSTYDGLLYNVNQVKDDLAGIELPYLHFDEAWIPYTHFHPLYTGKYAMTPYHHESHPTTFSTQSTHKCLAAFSQASMVHMKNGRKPVNPDLFNETFMMHTSTSPQYSIIASLDVATKMMSGNFGYKLVNESISEAIAFRQEFTKVSKVHSSKNTNGDAWFFNIWEPEKISKIKPTEGDSQFEQTEKDSEKWALKSGDDWHGFKDIDNDHIYLDPIKVTVVTPGINVDGTPQDFGVPAPIVSRYLMNKGVVDEKTGFYTMLFLFTIGVNKSKAMTLLSDLVHFKDDLDSEKTLEQVFPALLRDHTKRYEGMTLKGLAEEMHHFLVKNKASDVLQAAFEILPEQVMTPNEAYQYIVRESTELVLLDELKGRVILTMVAPYPPGIPVVMPGERLTEKTQIIIDYLQLLEAFDNAFPGFENEVHGADIQIINGKRRYGIQCLKA